MVMGFADLKRWRSLDHLKSSPLILEGIRKEHPDRAQYIGQDAERLGEVGEPVPQAL